MFGDADAVNKDRKEKTEFSALLTLPCHSLVVVWSERQP
jgi:hypothetical protein